MIYKKDLNKIQIRLFLNFRVLYPNEIKEENGNG